MPTTPTTFTGGTIVGTPSDIIWGSDGVFSSGIITSARKHVGGDKREIKDNFGNVAVVVYFNEKNECEITVLAQTSIDIPTRGDTITIAGVLCLVDDTEENWTNEKEKSFNVKATRYVANSLPSA